MQITEVVELVIYGRNMVLFVELYRWLRVLVTVRRQHTGDYALFDTDGYLWLLGRSDDVLKIAGHRLGTVELELSRTGLLRRPQ